MNLRSLRVFAAVMETATLARAAGRLHMSESAASRQLQLLEADLGTPLFLRDRKRLVPTPQGEALFPEALRVLSQIDGMTELVATAAQDHAPRLRIICHSRVLYGLVHPAIARLARVMPDLGVKLDVQPRRDLGRRMMQGLFDLGVSALPSPNDSLAPIVLGSLPLGVLLARDHPLASAKTLTTQDLRSMPYIALDDTTVVRQQVDASLDAAGIKLGVAHEVSTGASAYRLVADGLGFTFADGISLEPEIAPRTVLVRWTDDIRITYGAFRNPLSKTPGLDALIENLRAVVDGCQSH